MHRPSITANRVEGLKLLYRMMSDGRYAEHKLKNKNGRPGNEAMVVVNATAGCLMKIPGNSMIFCP